MVQNVAPNNTNTYAHVLLVSNGSSTMHIRYMLHLTFRHHASYNIGQTYRYSPEYSFYIFSQQIYLILFF